MYSQPVVIGKQTSSGCTSHDVYFVFMLANCILHYIHLCYKMTCINHIKIHWSFYSSTEIGHMTADESWHCEALAHSSLWFHSALHWELSRLWSCV